MDLTTALRDGVVTADDVACLLDVTRRLASPASLDQLIAEVRRAARALSGADGVTFVLRELDTVFYADEEAIAPLWKGRRFPIDSCISGWAITHAKSVVLEDIYADPRIPADAYRPTFVQSLLMVPVGSGRPLAAIGAYWATRHHATPREQLLIESLANTCSVALIHQAAQADLARAEGLGETQFRALFDAMPQLGWTARPDGHVDFFNRGWYDYTGARPEDMAGWGWKSVVSPAFLPRVLDRWERAPV
jgi:PAS domain-containing protein